MPIENVSDTARWVAVYRAMETARPDAIFRDPYANRLGGARGREIVREMKQGHQMAWAVIVRTAVLDELSRYEAIPADLTDEATRDALLRRLAGVARTALVITEGLLIYLEPEQAASLARALHAQPSIRWWTTDVASPMLLEWMRRSWGRKVAAGNAPFRFAPADSAVWFAAVGWQELQFRSAMEEARRLHREMRMMWLWRLLHRFAPRARRESYSRLSGCLLLERR